MTTAVSPSPARVDLARLQKLADDKLITTQKHPTLDLLIHNYTPVCQYSRAWDELTLMCRGLITDLDGNIVARPFPKFFNLSEHEGHEASDHEGFRLPPIDWHQDFLALKKYDGSLGILYFAGDVPWIATRGSFTSDQAIQGTRMFRAKGYDRLPRQDGMTFLFEIIYPQNRIVVDYGGMEDLVLLDVIDNATGRGCTYEALIEWGKEIGCPVVEAIPATEEELRARGGTSPANEEGYVVRFEDGTRVKIKFEEYVRLHRLVTGVSTKSIWESLASGQGVAELLERVPDEFNAWVKQTVADLTGQFEARTREATVLFADIQSRLGQASRKEFALEFVKHQPLTSVLFHILDGKYTAPLIWKMIKPAHSRPFKTDDEA